LITPRWRCKQKLWLAGKLAVRLLQLSWRLLFLISAISLKMIPLLHLLHIG
jgi:hypothetical protein